MRNPKLSLQLQKITQLLRRTDSATSDFDLQGHWGRYTCILVAGFLENSLQIIYSDFASQSSSEQVARYVSARLRGVRNPNAIRFAQVAGQFNPGWREELEEFLNSDGEIRKNAIDSIMSVRNQIAHGGTTGITIHRVREYLERSVEVIEFIEDQCLGNS